MSLILETIKVHAGIKVKVICIRRIPNSNLDPEVGRRDFYGFTQAVMVNTGIVPSLCHDCFFHILRKLFFNNDPATYDKESCDNDVK